MWIHTFPESLKSHYVLSHLTWQGGTTPKREACDNLTIIHIFTHNLWSYFCQHLYSYVSSSEFTASYLFIYPLNQPVCLWICGHGQSLMTTSNIYFWKLSDHLRWTPASTAINTEDSFFCQGCPHPVTRTADVCRANETRKPALHPPAYVSSGKGVN